MIGSLDKSDILQFVTGMNSCKRPVVKSVFFYEKD